MQKSSKTGILLIVLGVLIGAFFILKFTGNKKRSSSFRSELVEFQPEKVTKIEVLDSSDSLRLKKEGDQWWLASGKKADSSAVGSLLRNLQQIKPSRLASRKEEAWKDFQVDEAGTRVLVYEGGDKTLDIVLGRFGVEGQRSFYTYVRLSDESDVYVAANFMKMNINTDANSYRNSQVLEVDKDALTEIRFDYPDSAFTLNKNDDKWLINGNTPADSTSVAKYVQNLGNVSSRNFNDKALSEKVLSVQFRSGEEEITLSSNSTGQVSSTSNQDEVWNDEALQAKIFKGKSYFEVR